MDLAKALLIHSCTVPEDAEKEEPDFNRYYGYGIPCRNVKDMLSCTRSNVTLIFTGEFFDGKFIEFNDFPFPRSLIRNGKCYGEIKMTLVYAPPLDASHGQEYCRTNIDVHLGTYERTDHNGKVSGFKGEVPVERKWDERYESSRVEHGYKWYPIKSYRRKLSRGIKENPWRLMVDCHARLDGTYSGQRFVLLITINDPEGNDIYTEIVQNLRERGYIHNTLKIRNQVRQTIGI